jgi:hypothetical protein
VRQISPIIVGLALLLCTFGRAEAGLATIVRLRADHIQFYYDRYLIEADGHVTVQTNDGTTITGDTFSMDLKLNRFLIASNVRLRSSGGNLDGAAISDFLDFNRIYFVPVISKPDRWTYENNDYRDPIKGREMPGDVFYFPDLSSSSVSLSAKSVQIQAKAYVRFNDVRAYFLHQGVPLPSYYVYFGSSQDLEQNSLSGASFDATWNAIGDDNYISALHLRYDDFNKAYASFEQHIAGTDPHEYAVFSVNPFTNDDKYWNLVGGEHLGSKFQVDTFSQLFTDSNPAALASAQTSFVTLIQAFHHSSLQAFFNQTNYNLLGPQASATLNHPNFLSLTDTTFNNRIAKTPFFEQVSYQFGFNHDAIGIPGAPGLQDYNGVPYTTIWNHELAFSLSMVNVKFGDRDKAYGTYALNASTTSSRQWFSVPHHINTQNTTVSISRQYSRFVNAYLTDNILNTSDLYNHGGYVPFAPTLPDGTTYTPYLAFRGASTLRTATLGTTYSASPDLVTSITLAHHQDFPVAFPGLFPLPPLNALGQYIYNNYLGQPPWQLGAEVRARLLPHLVVDVQRTYYFHFGQDVWSPQFVVQFSE